MLLFTLFYADLAWVDPENAGIGGPDPPGESLFAIFSLRNSGTDPSLEAIGLPGSNCFSREACMTHFEIH